MHNEKIENGLFIFRRDLRLVDNNGLNLLSEKCKNIYTIFIFTPEQVSSSNTYKSKNCVQFMIESLKDLEDEIAKKGGKLYTFYGNNDKIISECIEELNIKLVCFNLDITPYARMRDQSIIDLCEKKQVYVMYDWDYTLHAPDTIMSGAGTPYQKFTPYYNAALREKVEKPANVRVLHLAKTQKQLQNKITLDEAMDKFTKENKDIIVHGGRANGLKTMHSAMKTQAHYSKTHNTLSIHTSLLSAYIKFGCVSIREVYTSFHGNKDFIRQLFWRDFYAQVLYHFPHVLKKSLKPNYDKIKWHSNASWFEKWCDGNTGFPIVDACMKQLNTTGWLHNRGRLIVASFLVKTLLIDWRKGEKYFAQQLVDYDVANNNGNWAWVSSSGADAQPYFRIFNPWEQSKKYDTDCVYIKKWLPELSNVSEKDIHNWANTWEKYKNEVDYPKPICDYAEQKKKALEMYREIYS